MSNCFAHFFPFFAWNANAVFVIQTLELHRRNIASTEESLASTNSFPSKQYNVSEVISFLSLEHYLAFLRQARMMQNAQKNSAIRAFKLWNGSHFFFCAKHVMICLIESVRKIIFKQVANALWSYSGCSLRTGRYLPYFTIDIFKLIMVFQPGLKLEMLSFELDM